MTRNKFLIPLFALILCMGALFFTLPAYASDDPNAETLSVDAVWLEGDMLNIEVTDKQTGINQTLAVSLTDYAGNSEYVSVQAVDREGNKSNTIQFKNPFYTPETVPDTSSVPDSQAAVPDGTKPLTPDGTGTVMDNVTDGDGKEFFTITTEDGNEFYMIIDRQRSTENVYLLNAVTEDDLAALAQKSGSGGSASAVPTTQPTQTATPEPTTQEPAPSETPSANNGGMNNGTVIFIVIAAVVVGGAGYYFKILRPKKKAAGGIDEGEDYEDDPDDYGDGDDDYSGDGEDE